MAGLPVVGAQVVIQGTNAFKSDVGGVMAYLSNLGRSLYLLERTTSGSFDGINRSVANVEKSSVRLAAANAKVAESLTRNYATMAEKAAAASADTIAQNNLQRDLIINNSRTVTANVVRDAQIQVDAQIAAARKAAAAQVKSANTRFGNQSIARNQQLATDIASVRANQAPGPVGRAQASVDIAQLRATAQAEAQIDRQRLTAAKDRANETKVARIAAATATRDGIIANETALSNAVVTSANKTAQEANRAAQSRAAAEIKAAQVQMQAQQQAAAAVAEHQAHIQQVTEATIKTVAALGVAFVAAFAVVVGASTNAASNFEAQMALIQGVTQGTAQEMDQLKQAIFALKDSPTQISDLAQAEYDLATAGSSATDIVNGQLKAVNDLIVASGNKLSSNTAAVAIATTTNAFKEYAPAGLKAADVTDVITAAANKSNQSFESVATAVQRSAGTLARSGVSLQDFGALVTVVGQQIRDGSTAGSALQRVFLDLQDPTEKQTAIMKKYGISLYDVNGNIRPTRDFLLGLNEAFGEGAIAAGKITRAQRDQALSSLFEQNAIRAVNAILDVGVDKFDEYSASASGAADAAIAPQLDTAATKYKILQKSVETAAIQFGDNFLPILKNIIDGLNTFVQSIPVDAIGNFTARMIEGAGAIAQFAAQLPITIQGIAGVAGVIATAFLPQIARVVAGLLATLAPIIALGTAFGLVAIIFSQESDNIGSILDGLFKTISGFFVGIFDGVKAFFAPFIQFVADNWKVIPDIMIKGMQQTLTGIGTALTLIFNAFKDFADTLGVNWAQFWKGLVLGALGPLGSLIRAIQALGALDVGADSPFKPIVDSLKSVGDAVDDVFNTIGKNGSEAATGFGKTFQALVDFAGPAAEKFAADVSAAFDGFSSRTGQTFEKVKSNAEDLIKKLQDLWAQATNPTAAAAAGETPFTPKSHQQTTAPGFLPNLKDFTDALKKLLDLARDTGQAIDKLNKDASDKLADIASKAADAAADAIASVNKSIQEAIADTNKAIAKMRSDRAQELSDRARQDALKNSQESASLSRDRQAQDAEVAHQKELEADQHFYDEEQKIADEAYKRQEDDANLSYDRRLQDAEIFHQEELDTARRAFDEQQDIAARAFQDQQDADYRAYQDKVQRDEMAYKHEQDQANAIRDLQKQLNEELAQDAQDTQQKIEEENARHLETLQNAQNQAIIDAENQRHNQQVGRITSTGEASVNKAQQAADEKRAELDAQYEEEVRDYERRQALEEADRQYRAQQEIAARDFQKQQAAEARAYEEQQAAAELVRKRQLEDAERLRQRAQEDEDRARSEAQEEAARQRREKLDDDERARKRQQDDEDRAYKREQDAQQRALEDQLAQEALSRRIAEANAERDAKIAALNAELAQRLDKIERERQQEVAAFLRDLQDKLQAIRQEFVDKLPDIIAKGGEAIIPIVNGFLAAIDAQIGAVAQSAAGAAGAIVNVGVQALGTLGVVAQQTASAINGVSAAIGSDPSKRGRVPQEGSMQSFDLVPQFAEGGFVPGPKGKPRLAIIHGGEYVIPVSALSATSAPAANMSSSSSTTSYNVQANYGRVQPEGTIKQDLQALIAVSRQ